VRMNAAAHPLRSAVNAMLQSQGVRTWQRASPLLFLLQAVMVERGVNTRGFCATYKRQWDAHQGGSPLCLRH